MYSYPHKTAYRSLSGTGAVRERLTQLDCNELYVHVPFCRDKCGYCNLFSVPMSDKALLERYCDAVCNQFREWGLEGRRFRALTIGGGTPLLLPESQLARLLSLTGAGSDICVETSPGETTRTKLGLLRDFGVRRVSIGVQSFDGAALDAIGRVPASPRVAHDALSLLKEFGFPCLNIDLIYGIPGQSLPNLLATLREALCYLPEEIFLYPLYIRRGTPIYERRRGVGNAASDETDIDGVGRDASVCAFAQYVAARDFIIGEGYTQVSMRRFALRRPEGKQSCGFEDMVGLGCGARSYLGDLHCCTPFALGQARAQALIESYMALPAEVPLSHGYLMDAEEQRRRYVIKNLLHCAGLPLGEYRQRFGSEAEQDYPLLGRLCSRGLAEQMGTANADRICLTPRGLSLSDRIGPLFISRKVRERMDAWTEG
jgi:oxygen-independent coproporphyrinogen-3 oxidase